LIGFGAWWRCASVKESARQPKRICTAEPAENAENLEGRPADRPYFTTRRMPSFKQDPDIAVDQQAHLATGNLQVGKQLSLMNRHHLSGTDKALRDPVKIFPFCHLSALCVLGGKQIHPNKTHDSGAYTCLKP